MRSCIEDRFEVRGCIEDRFEVRWLVEDRFEEIEEGFRAALGNLAEKETSRKELGSLVTEVSVKRPSVGVRFAKTKSSIPPDSIVIS